MPDPTATPLQPLARALLVGPPDEVARRLLGTIVVRDDGVGRRAGRIVETEAYGGPEDRASHARAGRTARTGVMYGPSGRAYVYLVYGIHHCLNVVCGPEGEAAAVLIRALQPLDGLDLMRRARGLTLSSASGRSVRGGDARLAAGPARLCQALGIDRSLDGLDMMSDDRLRLVDPARDEVRLGGAERVVAGPRVGVAYAGPEWGTRPWRFGIADHGSLSRPFREG